jgi:C4-dicarboxylate transporter DctM subunit
MVVFQGSIGKETPDAVQTADSQADAGASEQPQERVMTKMVALKEAFWGLMAPVIILGGIYGGIFTATEAAAVAVIYCTLVGLFIYRTLNIKKIWAILQASGSVSCMIAMIVVGGAILAYPIIYGAIPQKIIELIIAKNFNPWMLLFLINVILFALGMFVEILALVYLSIPLCAPVVAHMGWDNIWFAIIFLLNVNLALITPPMGGVLFIVSQIGGIPLNKVIKGAIVPIVIILFVLLLIVFVPEIATWLPTIVD